MRLDEGHVLLAVVVVLALVAWLVVFGAVITFTLGGIPA